MFLHKFLGHLAHLLDQADFQFSIQEQDGNIPTLLIGEHGLVLVVIFEGDFRYILREGREYEVKAFALLNLGIFDLVEDPLEGAELLVVLVPILAFLH